MLQQLLSAALRAGSPPQRAFPQPRNTSQQDTDPRHQCLSAAALFGCDSSWERHGLTSAGMEFGPNFNNPPKENKQMQQNPHHLHRFLLEEFKHTYATLRTFSPGTDSRTLKPQHAKAPGCPHQHVRGTGVKSPAFEVALLLLFEGCPKLH